MKTFHLISHTHWDREWYRTFQEFRLRLVHLVDGLLDTLDDSHLYRHFMLDGQTIVLDDYLQMRPENEDRIRQYVRNDRIIIGPWHILPDEFLVSPEATVRNLLQGERTCRRFGKKMRIGYIPDPFGHIGQMPQILKGFDIHVACVQRGLSDEPCEFNWQATDGSRVFMAYLRDGYGNAASLPTSDLPRFVDEVKRLGDSLAEHSAADHFLLMFGTDHMEPPADTAKAMAYAKGKLDGDELVHSTISNYVTAVQASLGNKEIPTVYGELRDSKRSPMLPGVLSARMWIKQRNRASETLLEKWAEPFSTFATLTGANQQGPVTLRKPAPIVRQAWRLLMENHPHDSICGCSVDQVHDEMKPRFDQVDQIGEEITRQSLEGLAGTIDTKDNPASIVVFNPTSIARTDLVSAAVELPPNTGSFELVDEKGQAIIHQTVGLGSQELIRVSLNAKELMSAFGSISEGRVSGMVIQDVQVRREGPQVYITAILSEHGEPNLPVYAAARQQIDELAADATVTTFNVYARSADTTRLLFAAPGVPGLGWRTFTVRAHPAQEKAAAKLSPLAKAALPLASLPLVQELATRPRYDRLPQSIENDFFKVSLAEDGTFTLLDIRNQAEYSGLNRFVDGGDCGDEYNYAPPTADRVTAARYKRVRTSRGPLQQTLTIDLELTIPAALSPDRKSRSKELVTLPIQTTVTLTNGVPRVDVQTRVDNRAKDHRLRVHFPAPFAAETGAYDGHFEVVERKVGVPAYDETWIEQPRPEVPQRAFTDVSNGETGLLIANRGLPESEVLKNGSGKAEVAVTLLRCVGWLSRDDFSTRKGHAGPFMETPGAQMPGEWTFEYSVIPHAGDWQSAFEQAYAFEAPLRAMSTGAHGGTLPPTGSFLEVTPNTFVISAVKEAEDGHGLVVRGYNVSGEAINATVKPWRAFKQVEQSNLGEDKRKPLKPAADGSVTVPVGAHAIATLVFSD